MSNILLDHEAIEAQIQAELHKLENIFSDSETSFSIDTTPVSTPIHRSIIHTPTTSIKDSVTISMAEIEESEAEKEALQDRVTYLLNTSYQFNQQFNELAQENTSLKLHIQNLQLENNNIKKILEKKQDIIDNSSLESENDEKKNSNLKKLNTNNQINDNNTIYSQESFEKLEFLLAETRSNLARSLQRIDDLNYQKEQLKKQHEEDNIKMMELEHVRNVYSQAYEDSLKHLEKVKKDSEGKIEILSKKIGLQV